MKMLCFIWPLGLLTVVLADVFVKTTNPSSTEAKCLDGAQSYLYFSKTNNFTTTGLIIHLMPMSDTLFCGGPSLASSLDNCVTLYDSLAANYWQTQMNLTVGVMADPSFKEWARVIIPSCDGTLFQGSSTNGVSYKGRQLTLRGNKIMKSHLALIAKKYDLGSFKRIILSGSGFGSIGASIWARYFFEEYLQKLNNPHFSVILDGLFTNFKPYFNTSTNFELSLMNMLKVARFQESSPLTLCTLRMEQWMCLLLQNNYPYISTNLYLITSQYDPFGLTKIAQVPCINPNNPGSIKQCSPAERAYIEAYRSQCLKLVYRIIQLNRNSVWTIGCLGNNFLQSARYDDQKVRSAYATVMNGMASVRVGERAVSIDQFRWPTNFDCSN